MIRWISFVLAVVGLAIAFAATTPTFPTPPDLPPDRNPSVNPFTDGIASLGRIEPATRQVDLSSPVSGLVTQVLVDVGQKVKAGDALLRLDDRELLAEMVTAKAALPVKQAAIDRWRALPRVEDLPPLRAAVDRARTETADREDELARIGEAVKGGARSQRDLTSAQSELAQSRARLAQAEADLAKAVAGGWKPDLVAAEAELEQQRAQISAIEIQLDRLVVRAPKDGTILRRSIEPGAYALAGATTPLLVLGDLSELHVRAEVDEEDIALVVPGTAALARTRGAIVEEFSLELLRIEPFARPKTLLSGSNSERVDTRVVEVVFKVRTPPKRPVYPGQAVDVYVGKAGSKENAG